MALNVVPLFPLNHPEVTHPVDEIKSAETQGERTPTKDEKAPPPDYKVKEEKERRRAKSNILATPLKKIDII